MSVNYEESLKYAPLQRYTVVIKIKTINTHGQLETKPGKLIAIIHPTYECTINLKDRKTVFQTISLVVNKIHMRQDLVISFENKDTI